jgi:tetraacyldisaccharide 4'-kinase
MIVGFPLALAYGAAVRLRAWCYRAGCFRTAKLKAPVICIGNLTIGGTGKTPTTIALATILEDAGYRVSVLLRGYKGRHRGGPLLVSDGRQIQATTQEAGDEALVIARSLPRALVTIGRNRIAAGDWVEQHFKVDVHLLDDGFQHLQLQRDLNLLIIDVTNPFGGGLLPSGRLREPLNAIRRADAALLSRTEPGEMYQELIAELRRYNPGLPCFRLRQRLGSAWKLNDKRAFPSTRLLGSHALAFAGIGNPAQFFSSLERLGISLKRGISLPDHHHYRLQDYRRLKREAAECGVNLLITTAKDAEKLVHTALAPLDVIVVQVVFEFEDLDGLTPLLEQVFQTSLR